MNRQRIFALFIAIFLLCGNVAAAGNAFPGETMENGTQLSGNGYQASSALSDWILGTDYGIVSGSIDTFQRSVTLILPSRKLASLNEQDKQDIRAAVHDMLSLYLPPAEAEAYDIRYQASGAAGAQSDEEATQRGAIVANLIFIHHSCGENWLRDGLCQALNDNGYHVADISYGWREYGDHTDTTDWPTWFSDDVMNLVYPEMGSMTAPNTVQPAAAENTIIMFKSCFPNSDVGSNITDEMEIYNGLLSYFKQHPDKMFVLVTPPPMIKISDPEKTRALCDWLVDRNTGWLSGFTTGNVFVFDLYNILTHTDAHHRYLNNQEVHNSIVGADTLYYDLNGDDHPNKDGNVKAAQEFIGLLNDWYQRFSESRN